MSNTLEEIAAVKKRIKELKEKLREETRAARAAQPKKKPGRKPISQIDLDRVKNLAKKFSLSEAAFRCDISLRTLYNKGITRKTLNEEK